MVPAQSTSTPSAFCLMLAIFCFGMAFACFTAICAYNDGYDRGSKDYETLQALYREQTENNQVVYEKVNTICKRLGVN